MKNDYAAGLARNVCTARDQIQEDAHHLHQIGLTELAARLHNSANVAFASADAIYQGVLSMNAEKRRRK